MDNQFFWIFIISILELHSLVQCVHFSIGNCPIYYEEPCRPELVKFILSTTEKNHSNLYELNPFKVSLPETFNAFLPTKILIHGFGGLKIDKGIKSIYRAYQNLGYNIIVVDWGLLSELPCYYTSYLNTWHVGQCIAILIVSLAKFGVNPESLHLLGFSLGAHIAGFAGVNLNKVQNIPLGRITGLDPALPLFATLRNEWKLDPSDARFVDIIHTSAGSFGKIEAIGHVDFYMNGGVLQPACDNASYPPLCSHVMAGLYYAESIQRDNLFIGVQCDNIVNYFLGFCTHRPKALMGEFADYRTRGSFYIETSNSSPFALGPLPYLTFENTYLYF